MGGSSERFGENKSSVCFFIGQLKEVRSMTLFLSGSGSMKCGSNGCGGDVESDVISVAVEVETMATADIAE